MSHYFSHSLFLAIALSSVLLLQGCGGQEEVGSGNNGGSSSSSSSSSGDANPPGPVANSFDDQCSPFYAEGKLHPTLRLLTSKQLENAVRSLNPNIVNYSDPLESHQVAGRATLADSLLMDSATTNKMFDLMEPLSAYLAESLTNEASCSAESIDEEANCLIPRIAQTLTGLSNLDNVQFEAKLRQAYQYYRADREQQVALQATILEHLMSTDMLFISEIGSIRDSSEGTYTFTGQELGKAMHWALAQKPPTAEWLNFFETQDWQNPERLAEKVQELLSVSSTSDGMLGFIQNYLYLDSETIQGLPQPAAGSMDELDQALTQQIQTLIAQPNFSLDQLFVEPINLMQTPSFLSRLTAKATKPSPVTRGHIIGMKLLCEEPPGAAVDFPIVDVSKLPATLTPREILEQHHQSEPCKACHIYMDPFGFPLDIYDIVGNRIDEWPNGQPIDTQVTINLPSLSINGSYGSTEDPTQALSQLTQAMVESAEFDQCMNKAMASYMSGFDLSKGNSSSTQSTSCSVDARTDTNVHSTIAQLYLSKSFMVRRESNSE